MKRRAATGFTLIEVTLAVAIAAVMIVAVQSTTQAMVRTARAQQEAATADARFQRFIEILRRDLQGWVAFQDDPATVAAAQTASDQLLLRFPTTADSLATAIQPAASSSRSVAGLRYVQRQSGTTFQIVRIECLQGVPPMEIVVLQSSDAPNFEYFQANKWIPQWSAKERPKCVRVTAGASRVVLAL